MAQPINLAAHLTELTLALARADYANGVIRLAARDMSGFTHIVATRSGLYVVKRDASRLIAHGMFYGVTVQDDSMYVFQACRLPRTDSTFGRILRFTIDKHRIVAAEVFADGLNTSCHQLDIVHGKLCVLETALQVVTRFALDTRERDTIGLITPPGTVSPADAGYLHVNSMIELGDHILLMLHNGMPDITRPSEVAVLDRAWHVVSRHRVSGSGCHNLLVTPEGRLLMCGSAAGELIDDRGARYPVSSDMTRGLSLGEGELVIGASERVARKDRTLSRGSVFFLDAQYRIEAELELPGGPCEIRRLDGRDRSISHFLKQSAGKKPGIGELFTAPA